MKTILFPLFFSVLTIACVLTSCSDDGDTTKPVIKLNSPEAGTKLKIGSQFCVDIDFEDNEALKSFKINVHDNIQNKHDHDTRAESEGRYFSYDEEFDDVSGKKNAHAHKHITVWPDAIEGEYHLMVYCTDKSGNESVVSRTIILSHEGEEHEHGHGHGHEH